VLEVAQTTSSLRLDSVQLDYPGATYAPSCIPQVATAWAPAWWCNVPTAMLHGSDLTLTLWILQLTPITSTSL